MPISPDKFREARKAATLSQAALAKDAGVSQQLISQIERGENLTTRALPKIARVLGRPVYELNPDFDAEADDKGVYAPLISWVSASTLRSPDVVMAEIDAERIYAPDLDPRGDWIALRVEGDSMDRISPPDSIIFVNRKDRRLVPNACYVIADANGEATYKRYRPDPERWEPVSTNLQHQPLFPAPGQSPAIIGRVKKTVLGL